MEMPTKTIIESHLKAINDSDFQNLIIRLLIFKGYEFISAPGATDTTNKTRQGAPDALFYNKNGKYVLCEMTTQDKEKNKKSFMDKLKRDIDHCFDESKTNIFKSEIGEVVLACNSRIDSKEHVALQRYIFENYQNDNLSICSIQNLAEDLVHFPDISEFFPDLSYFDGISTLKGFIDASENGVRPNLKNVYIKQEDLFDDALEAFNDNDIILINGNQSMGKTRLAVELAKEFINKNDYHVLVINYYYDNLRKDLLKIIQKNKKYVIIFDNYTQYDGIVYLMNRVIEIYDKSNFKFIFTLKPSFVNDLNIKLSNFKSKQVLTLNNVPYEIINKVIEELSKEHGFHIKKNHADNIIELSKYNIGFLLMILLPIIENHDYSYIDSAEKAYENYFNNYKSFENILTDNYSLKILGILSFFTKVNLDNNELILKISDVFNINLNENGNVIQKLVNYELLTKIGNVVEFSDSILSNYLFYHVFISQNILSFEDLVINFIDSYSILINQKIYDVIQAFGRDDFKNKKFESLVKLKSNLKDKNLISFYKIFNIYFEIKILNFVKDWLYGEVKEIFDINKFRIPNMHNYFNKNHIIELLAPLLYSSYDVLALKLFVEIIYWKPSLTKEVFYHLKENYSYSIYSLQYDYFYQNKLMDFLELSGGNENKEKIKEMIFIFLLNENRLFGWHHSEFQQISDYKANINRFKMPISDSLSEFRLRLLNYLLKLYDDYQFEVEINLKSYINLITPEYSYFILNEEKTIKKFFSKMDFNRYIPNILAYIYFNKVFDVYIEKFGKYSNVFPDFFEFNHVDYIDKINVLSLISEGYEDIDAREKISKIKNYLKIDQNYSEFFELLKEVKEFNNWYYNVDYLFAALIKFDENLFIEAFNYYCLNNYSLLKSFGFVKMLFEEITLSTIEIYELINNNYYDELETLNGVFFKVIPENQINDFIFYKLINYIKTAKNFYFLPENYLKFNPCFEKLKNNLNTETTNIVQFLTEMLIEKTNNNSKYLFSHEFCKKYKEYFKDNFELLKKTYFVNLKLDKHADYKFEDLEELCKLDKFFLKEYFKWRFNNDDAFYEDEYQMKFVWELSYTFEELSSLILFIINHSRDYDCEGVSLLFSSENPNEIEFFKAFIVKNYDNKKAIEVIFMNIKKYCSPDVYVEFLEMFLNLNNDFDIFRVIIYPYIQIRRLFVKEKDIKIKLDFYNKIKIMLEDFNSLDYIKHLCLVETKINELEIDLIKVNFN